MRHLRFSITGLMGLVLVAAVGLAALRNASETRAGGMLLLTCGILALAVVGALYRDGAQRAWWLSGLSPVIARLCFLTVPSLNLISSATAADDAYWPAHRGPHPAAPVVGPVAAGQGGWMGEAKYRCRKLAK